MAFITLLKFAVASSALYLSKVFGLWDFQENNQIHNKNLSIKPKQILFDKEDDKKPPCEQNWKSELKSALSNTLKTMQKIPNHWRRFGQILQDNIMSLFKSDDDK